MKSIVFNTTIILTLLAGCASTVFPAPSQSVSEPDMSVAEIAAKTEEVLDNAPEGCLLEPECVSDLLENI